MIKKKEGQTIQWSNERRTDNTMTKRKDRQYYDQKKEGQTIQWPKERTDNTMTERKRRNWQTMIYKTLHRKLQLEQYEPHWKVGVNSGAPEALANPSVIDDQCLILDTVMSSVLIE
jgi:hypothetical protein